MLPKLENFSSISLKFCYVILCVIFLNTFIVALPVKEKRASPQRFADEEFDKLTANESINEINNNEHPGVDENIAEELGIEYNRYLNEVVEALESDPEFRKKLENASEADIRSGKIAQELEYVNHQVRSKLDELKRTELDRLKELAKRQYELSEGKAVPEAPRHVDHHNPQTFEVKDLHKLIVQVTNDLAEADRKRRELFKEYELQKRYERDQKLSVMTDQEKEEFLKKEAEEIKNRKSNIAKADVHHPGSKKQLEEVWQEQDHMGKTEFNPKAFFVMHDLDGNHMWDEEEVKMLFLKELDKMYKEGMPQNDLMERAEEMERMREHVFKEADVNRDRLISWDEFAEMTRRQEFNQDPGWKPIDQQEVYSPAEVEAYERHRQAEVDRLIKEGRIPSVPPQYAHYGHPPQYHPGQPVPQHPNMPAHVSAQHHNPGVNGIQYVPGDMPPVQVDPYHYNQMHQNINPHPNQFQPDLQKPNGKSAPPKAQYHQVQYSNQENQAAQHGNYQYQAEGNLGQGSYQQNVNNAPLNTNSGQGFNQGQPQNFNPNQGQAQNYNQNVQQPVQNQGQAQNYNQNAQQPVQNQGLNQGQAQNLNQNMGQTQNYNQNAQQPIQNQGQAQNLNQNIGQTQNYNQKVQQPVQNQGFNQGQPQNFNQNQGQGQNNYNQNIQQPIQNQGQAQNLNRNMGQAQTYNQNAQQPVQNQGLNQGQASNFNQNVQQQMNNQDLNRNQNMAQSIENQAKVKNVKDIPPVEDNSLGQAYVKQVSLN